jgi:hypothetical protein
MADGDRPSWRFGANSLILRRGRSARGTPSIRSAPSSARHNSRVAHDELDELDDPNAPGWQPDPERPGYERWYDGAQLIGPAKKEPDPFSAFSPNAARSLRPGPNRDAAIARWGIVATLAGFALQQVVGGGFLTGPGIEQLDLILLALAVAASAAIATVMFSLRALKRAPRLGGKGIATVALVAALLLGLAPTLLLVAILIGGGV